MKTAKPNVTFRARFRKLLKDAGRTKEKFAEDSGVALRSLTDIYQGVMSAEVETLVRDTITRWFGDGGERARWLFETWQRGTRPGRRPALDPASQPFVEDERPSSSDRIPGPDDATALILKPATGLEPPAFRALSGPPDLPDILTPGGVVLLDGLARDFTEGTVERWAALGEEAIVAVEQGDFPAHVTVGQRIVDESGGLRQIRAAGHYLKAEGHRLLAGMNKDQQVRAAMLDASLAEYALAAEIYPHSPRAIRGSASVLEARGDLGQALDHYARAKGMSLEQAHTPSAISERPLLLHEILRVTRHEIHCISEIRRTSPASTWRRVNKEEELRGFLVHSQNSHHEFLTGFRFRQRWYLLEWFMALVFFGKVWGDLGDSQQMTNSLLRALKVRRALISGTEPLTAIERANLRWWMNAALSRDRARTWGSLAPNLDAFENALHTGSDREILSAMDEMIAFITAPSEQNTP